MMSTRREFLTQTTVAGLLAATSAPSLQAAAQDKKPTATTPMKPHKIPHTDLVVSRVAYGCAMLGISWDAPDFVERTVPMINLAYEQGINFFDLADVYGHGKAELALGQLFKQRPGLRERIVIQSKCGDRFSDGTGDSSVDNSREHIVKSVEGSLKRLGTDRLDIFLLHWADSLVQPEEVAHAFDQLQRTGKVRYFGVSNHSPYQIEILKKYLRQPLVANQIQLGLGYWFVPTADPLKGRFIHGAEGVTTLDYCRAHDIPVQAHSPLRCGSMWMPGPNLLKPADDATPRVKNAVQVLTDVAKEHDTSPAVIMLAWLLHHPARITPIIGGIKPEHVIENCTADRIELSRNEWYRLLEVTAAMTLLV